MLCKISGFHGSDYEECRLLGCYAVFYVRTDVSGEGILRKVLRLLVTANVPSSPIFITMMMDVIRSSESAVLTRAIRRNIPEDGILQE
jgi:hypothetical protein